MIASKNIVKIMKELPKEATILDAMGKLFLYIIRLKKESNKPIAAEKYPTKKQLNGWKSG